MTLHAILPPQMSMYADLPFLCVIATPLLIFTSAQQLDSTEIELSRSLRLTLGTRRNIQLAANDVSIWPPISALALEEGPEAGPKQELYTQSSGLAELSLNLL